MQLYYTENSWKQLKDASAGQYPESEQYPSQLFRKKTFKLTVTPTMISLLTLTQQSFVIHLKMEKRTLRPRRISARKFCKIPPNESEKLWLVKEIVLFGNMVNSYGVSRKSLVRWIGAYKERGIVHKSGGKPRLLTDTMKANIISEMTALVMCTRRRRLNSRKLCRLLEILSI